MIGEEGKLTKCQRNNISLHNSAIVHIYVECLSISCQHRDWKEKIGTGPARLMLLKNPNFLLNGSSGPSYSKLLKNIKFYII